MPCQKIYRRLRHASLRPEQSWRATTRQGACRGAHLPAPKQLQGRRAEGAADIRVRSVDADRVQQADGQVEVVDGRPRDRLVLCFAYIVLLRLAVNLLQRRPYHIMRNLHKRLLKLPQPMSSTSCTPSHNAASLAFVDLPRYDDEDTNVRRIIVDQPTARPRQWGTACCCYQVSIGWTSTLQLSAAPQIMFMGLWLRNKGPHAARLAARPSTVVCTWELGACIDPAPNHSARTDDAHRNAS